MATLQHYINPWMLNSIIEVKEHMDRNIETNIMEINKCLNAFELCVLTRNEPSVDVSTRKVSVESLREEIYTIQEGRVPESEVPCEEPAENIILATLFSTAVVPQPARRDHAKRH